MVSPVWAVAYPVDALPRHDVVEFDGWGTRDWTQNEIVGRSSKVSAFHIVLDRVQRPLVTNLA